MMNAFEEVKKAISKVQPGLDENKIVPSASLKEDLDIDSLDLVEIALALEDTFGMSLPEEDLEGITTISDVVSLIEAKLKVKSA
jgi:acyl carrier protein